ncbi:MAG: type II toxin-antitoxin system VapC family toxin [Chitinophagaceae bacterium]
MGQGFLIDSNVVINVLNNLLPPNGKAFVAALPPIISEVTRMELLGWPNATPAQLAPVQAFMQKATLLPINEAIILQVIAVRQSKKIKQGDAIIAATALVYDYTIVTSNVGDFKSIPGLIIIDPQTL